MEVPARAFFNWVGSLARKSTSLATKNRKGDTFNEVVAGSKQPFSLMRKSLTKNRATSASPTASRAGSVSPSSGKKAISPSFCDSSPQGF